ncbi:MAG: hypothetical protein JO262_17840 [Solirubrobacterales bacterium]|nr:hypothetical protein [Solirubrobacterales bacterium]
MCAVVVNGDEESLGVPYAVPRGSPHHAEDSNPAAVDKTRAIMSRCAAVTQSMSATQISLEHNRQFWKGRARRPRR